MQVSFVSKFIISVSPLHHSSTTQNMTRIFILLVASVNTMLLSSVKEIVDRSVVVCDFPAVSQVSLPVHLRVTAGRPVLQRRHQSFLSLHSTKSC
jgi:hypothetical protein